MPSDFAPIRSMLAREHLMHGLMDTRRMMSEESTTPDLVELVGEPLRLDRRDVDAIWLLRCRRRLGRRPWG